MESKMELSVSYYPVLRVIHSSLIIYYRGTTSNVPGQRIDDGYGSLPLHPLMAERNLYSHKLESK